MYFNTKQLYTPTLELHEFNERSLIIDTETVGAGPTIEIIELALGDAAGRLVFESVVQPVFNPLPQPSKHQRFERAEFERAPTWTDIWPKLEPLINNRLLIAYNAAFDRRAFAATCSRYRQSSTERGWRCAMQLMKQIAGTKRNVTLNEACARYGLAGGNHRAGYDVQATFRLLQALKASRL